MGPLADCQPLDHPAITRIDDCDIVTAHVGDQDLTIVPNHPGRRFSHRHVPGQRHLAQIDRGETVSALQGDKHHRAVRAVVEVARHGFQRETLHQFVTASLVDIDLGAGERGDHQKFAVRAEAELIGIRYRQPPTDREADRVEEQHFVGDGVANQQFTTVGGKGPMMRFAQNRNSADFGLAIDVDNTERCRRGIHHQNRAASLGMGCEQ